LYIRYLGIESYSIISFTLVLSGLMAVLDAGLSASMVREFSLASNTTLNKQRVFHTLESIYVLISLIASGLLFLNSQFIAEKWLLVDGISTNSIQLCIQIISFEVGLRLISNFYLGGLLGLDLQVKSNVLQIIYSIVRNGLVVIPIYFLSSLEVFFYWQLFSTVLYVFAGRLLLIKALERKRFFLMPKVEKEIIQKVWRFAGGMMLIAVVAAVNTQLDKLTLSAILPIEVLGFYTLSFSLANGLLLVSTPIATALLPKMTSAYSVLDMEKASSLFILGQKIISVLLFSGLAMLTIFSNEILWIWTNDLEISNSASKYLPWLALGASFLGLQILPFNLAIANGFTRFNNVLGIISLFITIPGYWLMTKQFNGIGAAWTFASVQVMSGFIYLYLINKKYLHLKFFYLFGNLILTPIVISFLMALLLNFSLNMSAVRWNSLMQIVLVFMLLVFSNISFLFRDVLIKNIKTLLNRFN
jgi:O-antigen/teichoic acid export membrane protein